MVTLSQEEKLRKELEEANSYITFLEEQLEIYNNTALTFLGDSKLKLDNLSPEDLEYALVSYEDKIEKAIHEGLNEHQQNSANWTGILELCKTLGFVYPETGISIGQELKIFIKSIVRDRANLLQQCNVKASKLEKIRTRLKELEEWT